MHRPTSPPGPVRTPALRSGLAALTAFTVAVAATAAAAPAQPAPPAAPTYADLQPLFQQRCVLCHAGSTPAAGLALDTLAGLRKGSANGPVVVVGQPAKSELLRRVQGASQPRMPLTGAPWLSQAEEARIAQWISAGLPEGTPVPPAVAAPLAAPPAGQAVTWAHVAPIFATRCASCHSVSPRRGPPPENYVLSSWEATVSANDRVRVVPGRPEASEVLRRIRGQALPRMPFGGPPWLDEAEVRLVERWIADGARDAGGRPAPLRAGARIRLAGTVSPDGTLDGLPLPAADRPDKRPRPGQAVELRGWLMPDGRIDVERVRAR